MLIFSRQGKITEQDDKTNIVLDFIVPEGIKKLTVKYSYNPKEVEDKTLAGKAVVNGMKNTELTLQTPKHLCL